MAATRIMAITTPHTMYTPSLGASETRAKCVTCLPPSTVNAQKCVGHDTEQEGGEKEIREGKGRDEKKIEERRRREEEERREKKK
jgi:hypothetical protein